MTVHGIHHVTAIAADPQENLDFYVGLLGMRLVKRSVNQDDPGTYHFFFADGTGHPGTDLTFFPWPHLAPGRPGTGLTTEVALAVPAETLPYWSERLAAVGVATDAPEERFGERVLPFSDPHGLRLVLAETGDAREFTPWDESPVPPAQQIRGLHAVRLTEPAREATEGVLRDVLGFTHVAEDAGWQRYGVEGGGSGKILELRVAPDTPRGRMGTGTVHHVAFRVPDDATQAGVRAKAEAASLRPTPVIDRFWFRSVYFLEPGGALFELATDGPGFAVDEDARHLGERLILPPWLEPNRAGIEAALPPVAAPRVRA
ncbi:MAG: ring-cleaving dioxygenase [Gemmatimonadota bacterium]|nr:ring-cleaving dioxygenase [Gemmatimonadota bacterium]